MKDKHYAVIDTNVLVSAVMSKRSDSPTVLVVESIFNSKIVPVFNDDIIKEYSDVLSRSKFNFDLDMVGQLVHFIKQVGVSMERSTFLGDMPDPKDRVFYEVSLTGDSYLVTGNKKHFPITLKVVTPAEMIEIIEGSSL